MSNDQIDWWNKYFDSFPNERAIPVITKILKESPFKELSTDDKITVLFLAVARLVR
jgi:hypothetical protein